DMFVGDMACWWLDTKPQTEPLFLEIGFPGPHPPYDPIPRYVESSLKKDLPLLDVTQEELDNQPEPLKGLRQHNQDIDHDSVVLELNPTAEQRHRQRAYYLANVTMIDEKIGQILESLDRNGYLDNSIVIFTSDHGDCLTDHGHSQKWTMYDTITKMPLIVWAPGRIPGGRTVDGLCQQMDIGPALLELAGAEVPEGLEAKSILPAIKNEDWNPRDYVFAEQAQDGILTDTQFMTMVRNQDWKLVHFLDEPWGQLFDLKNDPQEIRNLWDDPDHIDKKRELLAVLREWRIRSGYKTSQWAAEWR
ncbi:sulfatase-like hydrolase/transferase, partial [bacterium]|nr:sulfatase-like hydrolase/transferase [bacterium]